MADDLLDEMDPITRRAESRNRDYVRPGVPVRSNRGALYAMQVMPATAHDPGYGVTPATADNPTEYNRVGHDLLGAFQRRYNDPTSAWAAYNWGPGHVDRAKARFGENWLSHAPAGVRAYAQGNAQQLKGRPMDETDDTQSVMDTDDTQSVMGAGGPLTSGVQADTQSGPLGSADREQFMRDYQSNMSDISKLQKQQSATREQRYRQGIEALKRRYQKPDIFSYLSQAFLSPTRVPGFKGMMMNLAPALANFNKDAREAEAGRADALQQLQQRYDDSDINNQIDLLKLRGQTMRDASSLFKQPQTVYDPNLHQFVPRDHPVVTKSGVLNGQRVFYYTDGTMRTSNPDGSETVYDQGGRKVGVVAKGGAVQ